MLYCLCHPKRSRKVREAKLPRSRRIPYELQWDECLGGVFTIPRVRGRELPEVLVPELRGMGSFDCIAGRFADGNFAQDDRAILT